MKTIAVVGASANQDRDSYKVMEALIQHGYQIFPINPNEEGNLILGAAIAIANLRFSFMER